MVDTQSNDNTTCVVCFKNVLYFSIGECDHPVCFECSTRMRVLCLQNECPICRQDLSRVVFTDIIQPYKELRNKAFTDRLFERQYKIGFCSQEIKDAYEQLLENRCKICDNIPPFRTYSMLSDHMRKVHERYFCDLCVKHLKLGHHRRKGDLDDTSHRGHPLCEFCEERFMDADELYRHLRKEHLYCHLCDADGRNLYYASHSALAQHFRTDHYLCEEGGCAGEHLTAVFRSDIDLKAHKMTVHNRGMPRGAARQARTLELQFNITPHPLVQRAPRERDRERERAELPSPVNVPVAASIDTRSDEQFPRLSAAPAAPNLVLATPASKAYRGSAGLARTDKNFPALDGAAGPSRAPPPPPRAPAPQVAATLLRNSKPSVPIQLHSQPAASSFRLTPGSGRAAPARKQLADEDFPSLGLARDDHPSLGASTPQPPKVASINSQEMIVLSKSQNTQPSHQSKKAQLNSEAFPALSSTCTPAAPPQWITVSKTKDKAKSAKQEPPPQPREKTFNPVADFPTLPLNTTKTKPVKKTPQPSSTLAPSEPKPSKKEKKKNSAKKENIAEVPHVNGVIDKKIAKELSYGVSMNNNQMSEDKKIKSTDTLSTVTVNVESNRNVGNGDFSLATKDYPPLNSKTDNVPPKKLNGSVPPGFKPRPACDGMTFTNSSGQTFPAPVHKYITPPDFEQRNRKLVKKFAAALGSPAAVEDFKVASRAFRDGITTAEEFYEHCRSAVGSELDAVFPEMVALLPDIAKQQELVVGRSASSQLRVCATCGQLLAPADHSAHDAAHWPALGQR
ncbi:hypothetical protein ACJJTC_003922 [Scirpophaga incertulas]